MFPGAENDTYSWVERSVWREEPCDELGTRMFLIFGYGSIGLCFTSFTALT